MTLRGTRTASGDAVAESLETQWELRRQCWPAGWQGAAWATGAITRRRAIQSADALLRLIFAYAWNDGSLRATAAWARRIGLAQVSDVAALKRLRHAPAWLGPLRDQWFRTHGGGRPACRTAGGWS